MRERYRTLILSFIMVFVMGLGSYSHAQEAPSAGPTPPSGYKLIPEDLVADLNVSFYSQYVWRGYELSRDSMVVFPQLTVGYKGFAVTTWIDLDTDFNNWGGEREFKLQETDVIVSYSNSYKPWKLNYTLGWILYDFQPSQDVVVTVPAGALEGDEIHSRVTDTKNQEIFLTLGLDTILKPTLSIYQEIELGHAWYFQFGISHSFNVYKDWSLDTALTASYYHNTSFGEEISAFHDGNLSVGLKIPINNYLSIKPNLQYSFPLSQSAADRIQHGSMDGRHNNFVYGGVIVDLAI